MREDEIVNATSAAIEVIGVDMLTPLLMFIFGADGLFAGFTVAEASALFASFWSVFAILSYIISAIFLFLYVYASVNVGELYEEEDHHNRALEEAYRRKMTGGATTSRFNDMKNHINSENPNDWKLAIIEADIILDEALKRQGYAGTSLGERLRSISPAAMRTLDDAWEAHKIRNEIAHSGVDFVLTHKLARETIVRYERVFGELGLLDTGHGGGGHGHH
ncbi:MAG: hypothetical protein RLZZ360_778 [Candidatus Parcubacteria bacterium]|jgi:uncharacterized membrane protein